MRREECDNGTDDTTWIYLGDREKEDKRKDRLALKKALKVVQYASKTMEQLGNSQEFLEQKGMTSRAPLEVHHSQFELGKLLGQGTFSDVFEIKSTSVEAIDPSRYVVKVLREKMVNDAGLFAACAAGLATEATILSLLNHENIIHVKAWSQQGVCAYSTGKNDGYFFVLDRLDEMLTDRFENWKHEADKLRYSLRHRHSKLDHFFHTRLQVAKDLASAVVYLHAHRIVHRDIKPANVGFQNGTLKLFDFDVSRILPTQTEEGQRFNLTAVTGTRRYMSPECGLAEPYNEKTDVFSFVMLLNEIISLQKSFLAFSKREHEVRVWRFGMRPAVPSSCPRHLRLMIEKGWSRDIDTRPSMQEIHEILSSELSEKPRRESPTSHRLRFRPFKMPKILPPASIAC